MDTVFSEGNPYSLALKVSFFFPWKKCLIALEWPDNRQILLYISAIHSLADGFSDISDKQIMCFCIKTGYLNNAFLFLYVLFPNFLEKYKIIQQQSIIIAIKSQN